MRRITPVLEETGDLREVSGLVQRLLREGTPADRQRRAVPEGGLPALVGLVTDVERTEHPRPRRLC
ncbi:hypothetical protein ACGFZK_06595 [Streptomyces sp. NPDC048257]|uniref:hypothetical protein n=1 Tax=Streptomyces sp. NPDC048257 TaxID=3365526 RepID=UPI00371AD260